MVIWHYVCIPVELELLRQEVGRKILLQVVNGAVLLAKHESTQQFAASTLHFIYILEHHAQTFQLPLDFMPDCWVVQSVQQKSKRGERVFLRTVPQVEEDVSP